MITAAPVVLDASALLAYLMGEPGGESVREVLPGAVMSAANWAEVLERLCSVAQEGADVIDRRLRGGGLVGDVVHIVPVTHEDAVRTASLRSSTRALGLSLGDRICLATGLRLGATVVTADRAWSVLSMDIPISVIH